MNGRLMIVAGAAAAAVALLVLHAWQQQVMEEFSPGEEVEVLTAADTLEAGTVITSNMLEARPYAGHLLEGIGKPLYRKRLRMLIGRTLAREVKRGEILREADFTHGIDRSTLADKIEKNQRAVPFPVGELNAFSGLIEPGDQVDILLHLPHPRTGKPVIKSFLERVEVLATGDRIDPGQGFGGGGTITLLLDREQAAAASLAQRNGELIFLLRSPEETGNPPQIDEFSVEDLVEPDVVPIRPRPRPPKKEKVIDIQAAGRG